MIDSFDLNTCNIYCTLYKLIAIRLFSLNAVPVAIKSYGGYGPQFHVFFDLRVIAQNNLTTAMINQIVLHVISFNEMIVKAAGYVM